MDQDACSGAGLALNFAISPKRAGAFLDAPQSKMLAIQATFQRNGGIETSSLVHDHQVYFTICDHQADFRAVHAGVASGVCRCFLGDAVEGAP